MVLSCADPRWDLAKTSLLFDKASLKCPSSLSLLLYLMKEIQKLFATPTNPPNKCEPGSNFGSQRVTLNCNALCPHKKLSCCAGGILTAGITFRCGTHNPDVWHHSSQGICFRMSVLVSRPLQGCGMILKQIKGRVVNVVFA